MRARTRVRARASVALALIALAGAVGLAVAARPAAAGAAIVHAQVTLTGNGRGHLATSDGHINCVRSGGITSGACAYDYDVSGGFVEFTYVYGSESDSCYVTFGGCVTGGLGPSGFIGPDSPDQLISIEFRLLEPVKVAVTKQGAGGGTVKSTPRGINCGSDCKSDYAKGSTFTLKATAKSGSTFAGWTGGPCDGQGSTCTFTIGTGPYTVFASFDKKVTATPTPKVTEPPPTAPPTEGPTPIIPTPFPTAGPTATPAPLPTSPPATKPASDDSGRSTLILALGSLLLIILAAAGLYAMRSRRATTATASGSPPPDGPPPPPPTA